METSYFMIIDGQQAGPFVREELKYHNIRPESMVWREGLENWVAASALPELADLFALQQPPAYPGMQQPSMQQPVYGQEFTARPAYGPQPSGMQSEPIPHTNWLPWAIVCTVLGCMTSCITLILGIIGIVQANKANDMYNRGNRALGDSANSSAKTVTICGLILGVISIIGMIFLFATGYFTHMMAIIDALD